MLPPGHIAGGYLVTFALLNTTQVPLDPTQKNLLLSLGMFTAFAPDLDMFFTFAKKRGFRLGQGSVNHRKLVTHTPLFWIVVGGIVALFLGGEYGRLAGLTVSLGALSHLALDSIQYGVQWLYPFTRRLYSILDTGVEFDHLPQQNFFSHWFGLVWAYATRFTVTFVLELIVIVIALVILA